MEGLPEGLEAGSEEIVVSGKWLTLTVMISVSIALLDVCAAGVVILENKTSTKALMAKSEAALYANKASDQWNYYQAKTVKRSIAELELDLNTAAANTDAVQKFQDKIDQYKADAETIKQQAEGLEAQVESENRESDALMERHHHLEMGGGLLHVAVAIASVALIVRHRWFWCTGLALGGMGVMLTIWAQFTPL